MTLSAASRFVDLSVETVGDTDHIDSSSSLGTFSSYHQ